MSADPRPFTAVKPDGTPDEDTERRFSVLFRDQLPFKSARPVDLTSALKLLQEIHDRANKRT
jgi:hypothetical protein